MDLDFSPLADISLGAFGANVSLAKRELAGEAKLMIAIKSDAYGHGARELALAAITSGAEALAVLDIDTGVAIRQVTPGTPVLCWLLSPHNDFREASEASLDLGISALWQIEKLRREAPGGNTRVHLKIDTGLHRNGALAKDWPELVAAAATAQSAGDISVVGIWSHLADTSLAEDLVALEKFHHAVEVATSASLTPELFHIAASAAASDLPQARLDLVRVGIIAYGISPFDDRSAKDLGFAPVMTLRAPIISVDEKRHTARVGIGYGDGVLPLPPNTGWVAWKGTRLDIREVAVDYLVVGSDPTTIPTTGDRVTLWGDPDAGSPLAEDWASWAGTIGDEVVAALGAHIQRRFID